MYSLRRKGKLKEKELKEKPKAKWDIRSCDLSARCHLGGGEGQRERKQINKQASSVKEAG